MDSNLKVQLSDSTSNELQTLAIFTNVKKEIKIALQKINIHKSKTNVLQALPLMNIKSIRDVAIK